MTSTAVPELTSDQASALERFAELKVGAAFMEQGTGKSRVAVELANYRAEKLDDVLWVTPFSVLSAVEAEVAKWGCKLPVRFLGYETLSQSDRTYLEVLEWVQQRRLLIIADESTFIKNATSKRHERMLELRKHADYALALNGTPLTRNLWDVKRQMDWLSPQILKMDDRKFRCQHFTEHVTTRTTQSGREVDHYWYEEYEPNIPHLHSLIKPYVFEARLQLGIPERETRVEHPAGQVATEAYEKARDDFFRAWECYQNDIDLYTMLGAIKRIAATDPVKCESIAEEIEGAGRTIVFCQFREEQRLIGEHLSEHLVINGDTPPAARDEAFRRFEAEELPLLLTYGTGAFGLNLQAANTAHFASQTYDWGQMEQARSRIRRMGQERAIEYTVHLSEFGIEEMVARNLSNKDWLACVMRREIDPRRIL